MRKDDCFLLGYVIKPHGLKGEIVMHLDVDDPEPYKSLESVFLEIEDKLVPFFIMALNISGNRAIVSLEEIDSLESALALKGLAIFLPDSFLPELKEGQFYFHQVIGYSMHDKHLGLIGSVNEIFEAGKQHLFAVDHKGKEILIPLNDAIIDTVDHKQQIVFVNLPEGLLDVYLSDPDTK